MARKGTRVLVLEREVQFGDQLRGEALVPREIAEAKSDSLTFRRIVLALRGLRVDREI